MKVLCTLLIATLLELLLSINGWLTTPCWIVSACWVCYRLVNIAFLALRRLSISDCTRVILGARFSIKRDVDSVALHCAFMQGRTYKLYTSSPRFAEDCILYRGSMFSPEKLREFTVHPDIFLIIQRLSSH